MIMAKSLLPPSYSAAAALNHCNNGKEEDALIVTGTSPPPDYESAIKYAAASTTVDDGYMEILPEERRNETRFQGFVRKYGTVFGTILAITAGLTFTTANVIQKLIPALNFWDLLLVRAFVQCLIMFPTLLWKEIPIFGPRGVRLRVIAQGFIGGVLLLCIFIAIKHIPLGDASAIFFSAPFFTMIFSTFMLREHFGVYRGVVSAVLIFGVVLLCRPPAIFPSGPIIPPGDDDNSTLTDELAMMTTTTPLPDTDDAMGFGLVGTCCAWAVPILSAVVAILNRQCKHVHFIVLTFWFGVGALCIAFVGFNIAIHQEDTFAMDFQLLSAVEWTFTFIIVFLGIAGNIIMTIALRHVTPAKAMVFRSFEVILNYVLQLTIFTSVPFHWTDPVGASFIMVSVIIMGFEPFFLQRYNYYTFL